MVRDIKYIIKRIIIGVGIALILMNIKGSLISDVMALQVDSYPIGQYSTIVNNMTSTYTYDISGRPWSSLPNTYGYINGSIALIKVDGTSTSVNIMPLMVYVNSGNYTYPCNISSTAMENSTFNGGSYSFRCPVRMTSSGITSISVQFETIQTQLNSLYRLAFGSLISYEIYENTDVEVNVDTNGVISENQTQGNLNRQQMQNSTNSIINNQNNNTDKEIESQKVCTLYDISNTIEEGFLDSNGLVTSSNNSKITDYINIVGSTIEKLSQPSAYNNALCFYNTNKAVISCLNRPDYENMTTIVIPNNASYVRFTINIAQNKPTFKVCTNGNQAISNSVNDLNNTLNDSDVSDPNSDITNMQNKLASNNSITQLLTLPITLFQNVLNNINSTCSSYSLGALYGHNLVLPCINLESILGSTLWGVIDVLISGLFILSFRKKMVDIFNHMSSLNDRGNELE